MDDETSFLTIALPMIPIQENNLHQTHQTLKWLEQLNCQSPMDNHCSDDTLVHLVVLAMKPVRAWHYKKKFLRTDGIDSTL